MGLDVEISANRKTVLTGIESVFLKSGTRIFGFAVHPDKTIKIKFDFQWYVRKGTPMSLSHFISRAQQSGHLHEEHLTVPKFRQLLERHIESLDVIAASNDVSRFVMDADVLKIWSRDYFPEFAN